MRGCRRVTELLGFEDEVVIEYVFGQVRHTCMLLSFLSHRSHFSPIPVSFLSHFSQLEEGRFPDAKTVQINLTGFMESNTPVFMGELWAMLVSAQGNLGGVPSSILEAKKAEILVIRFFNKFILALPFLPFLCLSFSCVFPVFFLPNNDAN